LGKLTSKEIYMTAIELGNTLHEIRKNTKHGNRILEFQKFCIKYGNVISDMSGRDIYKILDIGGYKYSYSGEMNKFVKLSKHVKLI
jgi:hypothetical protein